MQTLQFIRNKNTIQNVATGELQTFPSISKAKQWSRNWQKANGGLGVGALKKAK